MDANQVKYLINSARTEASNALNNGTSSDLSALRLLQGHIQFADILLRNIKEQELKESNDHDIE